MKRFLTSVLGSILRPNLMPRRQARRASLAVETLEGRVVPALTIMTDMTQLASQFGRHSGPTTLWLNFDGHDGEGVATFQGITGDRNRDIHDILFKTQEVFAP